MAEEKPETRNPKPETAPALTFDEARQAFGNAKAGLKVKGSNPPFGGSWRYEKDKDELTLVEPPTRL